jgi:hypothetical protein
MRPAVKLERGWGVLAALVAALATGCGPRVSSKPISAPKPSVSTTRLMSAELRDGDDAPKVGKSQHSSSSAVAEVEGKKDRPHGRVDRKRGGFSGYK